MNKGLLPIFLIEAKTCGEAWFKTLEKVYRDGKEMPQHYGEGDAGWSREATVLVNVTDPLKVPRYHFADGIAYHEIDYKLEKEGKNYVTELLEGLYDDKVDDPKHPLSYTYHRRLWNWGQQTEKHNKVVRKLKKPLMDVYEYKLGGIKTTSVNQFENLINKALEEKISRKLQMITWLPHQDMHIKGSPCLQRIWVRLLPKEDNIDEFDGLVFQAHFRSRDLFQAWGSNAYGLVELGKLIADTLSKKMSMKIELKQYVDFSNSLHVYQKSYDTVQKTITFVKKRISMIHEKILDGSAGYDVIQGTRCILCKRGKIDNMKCDTCGFNYAGVTLGEK